jgi:hypothetical protein
LRGTCTKNKFKAYLDPPDLFKSWNIIWKGLLLGCGGLVIELSHSSVTYKAVYINKLTPRSTLAQLTNNLSWFDYNNLIDRAFATWLLCICCIYSGNSISVYLIKIWILCSHNNKLLPQSISISERKALDLCQVLRIKN